MSPFPCLALLLIQVTGFVVSLDTPPVLVRDFVFSPGDPGVCAVQLLDSPFLSWAASPVGFVYRHGPSVLGCWEGLSDSEVCARLIQGGQGWVHDQACACMIVRKQDAWVLSSLLALLGACVAVLVCLVWRRCGRTVVHVHGVPVHGAHVAKAE